jgi:hypothetical protein
MAAKRDPRSFVAAIRAKQRAELRRYAKEEMELSAALCRVTAEEVEATDPAAAAALRAAAADYEVPSRLPPDSSHRPRSRRGGVSFEEVQGTYWDLTDAQGERPAQADVAAVLYVSVRTIKRACEPPTPGWPPPRAPQ